MTSVVAPPATGPRDRVLRLIALFKFCKAVLLVIVGLGALQLLDPEVAARAQRWVAALASSNDRSAVQRVLAWVGGLSPRHLEALGVGAFLYALLFTIEGVGLWRGRRWAEYLTVMSLRLNRLIGGIRISKNCEPMLIKLIFCTALVFMCNKNLAARGHPSRCVRNP